jgi:non-ribosomal peptide synthetase component F
MSVAADSKTVSTRQTSGGAYPVLTEVERCETLVEWNRAELDRPRDKYVHQLFEEQVERTPDAEVVDNFVSDESNLVS